MSTTATDTTTQATRIYMIEDEALLRDLFCEYVQTMENVELVGIQEDGLEGLKEALEIVPDLVVVDIRLPEVNGLEILFMLRRKKPDVKIIVFTGSVSLYTVRLSRECGADGYVEKSYGLEELRKAIEIVMQGGTYYSPHAASLLRQL